MGRNILASGSGGIRAPSAVGTHTALFTSLMFLLVYTSLFLLTEKQLFYFLKNQTLESPANSYLLLNSFPESSSHILWPSFKTIEKDSNWPSLHMCSPNHWWPVESPWAWLVFTKIFMEEPHTRKQGLGRKSHYGPLKSGRREKVASERDHININISSQKNGRQGHIIFHG